MGFFARVTISPPDIFDAAAAGKLEQTWINTPQA